MRSVAALGILALCAAPAPASGQTTGAMERWFVNIRGPATVVRAELQFSGNGGRILLTASDSTWFPLQAIRRSTDSLFFTVPGIDSRFELERIGVEVMHGMVTGRVGAPEVVDASLIVPGTHRWPVPPRVTVSQLILGSSDTVTVFPAEWLSEARRQLMGRMHPPEAPWDVLASRMADEGEAAMLGFTRSGRELAVMLLEEASAAEDRDFIRLFRTARGGWRVDLHDVAWELAGESAPTDLADLDVLTDHLIRAGYASGLVRGDTLTLRRAVWRIWSRIHQTGEVPPRVLDPAFDSTGTAVRGLRALLIGYDGAVSWWTAATHWLMTSPWIDNGAATRVSVRQVVSDWWGEEQEMPRLLPAAFGGAQAAPVVGIEPLAHAMIRAANGTAAMWFETPGAATAAVSLWQQLGERDPVPVRLVAAERTMPVLSPLEAVRGRFGWLVAPADGFRIDPAIIPALSVATLIHEWQHLVAERKRLGTLAASPSGLRIPDSDPWISEGLAEWATDRLTGTFRGAAGAYREMEGIKRTGLERMNENDPHVLGFKLVSAASQKAGGSLRLQQLLAAHLDDPVALARALRFTGRAGEPLRKPATLMLIPETTFTIDGGVSDHVTQRILIPE